MVATRTVTYPADGLTMVGHLARPEGAGPWPAVLFAHDGVGLNDLQRGYADRLAEHGWLAFAMEYHGGRWFSDPDALLARVLPLIADPRRMQDVGRAALDVLQNEPGADPRRLAAVGFGAGGSIVLELARAGVAFDAVAAVHPAVPDAHADDWRALDAPLLLATGSADPLCTPDQVLTFGRALDEAGVDWRAHVYGGALHAFWHPPVRRDGTLSDGAEHEQSELGHAGHHPAHARRMWDDVVGLLTERFTVPTGS